MNMAMHTIQAVADRTGLTPDVIRVWERRHQAISPQRTSSNQRNYNDDDIERLLLFRKLTDIGMRISNIARMTTPELQALLQKQEVMPPPPPTAASVTTEQELQQAAIDTIHDMNTAQLEAVLQRGIVELGMIRFLTRFIAPLVIRVGEQWRDGSLRTSQEHFCSAHLRSFLGRFLLEANPADTGPVLVVATPPGHFHELGALMVAVVAAQSGWRPLFLGASVPAEELLFCARYKNARAVALSITYPSDDDKIPGLLVQLRRQLPPETALIAGGACLPDYLLRSYLLRDDLLPGDLLPSDPLPDAPGTHFPESLEALSTLLLILRR